VTIDGRLLLKGGLAETPFQNSNVEISFGNEKPFELFLVQIVVVGCAV
jgi:hypothetical protein